MSTVYKMANFAVRNQCLSIELQHVPLDVLSGISLQGAKFHLHKCGQEPPADKIAKCFGCSSRFLWTFVPNSMYRWHEGCVGPLVIIKGPEGTRAQRLEQILLCMK